MPTPRLACLIFIAAGLALPLGGALAVEDKTAPPQKPAAHATESLEDCMRKWDPGTHMTKEAWRETCLRIKNEREPYVKGYR